MPCVKQHVQLLADGITLRLQVDQLLSHDNCTVCVGVNDTLVIRMGGVDLAVKLCISFGNLDLDPLWDVVEQCWCEG